MFTEAMKVHGAFSWVELMSHDVEGSKAFYSELLGWTLEPCPMGDDDYTVAKVGDKMVAGIMATPEKAKEYPTSWGAYITVDDVDGRSAHAANLGAEVCLPPQDIEGLGRFSVIKDPQGAYVTLIKYSNK